MSEMEGLRKCEEGGRKGGVGVTGKRIGNSVRNGGESVRKEEGGRERGVSGNGKR